MNDLSQHAIAAALRGDWQEALKLNLKIINSDGDHPDVLNRTARAYAELGEMKKALGLAKKVLTIDPFNAIAQKSITRWNTVKNGKVSSSTHLSARAFLEEPGKTKIVPLVKLSDPKTLLSLDCGSEVVISPHQHSISINNTSGKYIGRLPDDIANRISKLMNHGNEYQAYVKCATTNEVKLFLREIKRAKEVSHIPSFPSEKLQYVAFAAPELVHNKKQLHTKSL